MYSYNRGEMQIVYAREPFPTTVEGSIFLAGPTPRSPSVKSWRSEALDLLKQLGFTGHVFVPEPRDGKWSGDYDSQIEWEEKGLQRADCIAFWIPREMRTMPGLTTNDEWGTWKDSGKVLFGAPPDADSVRYQRVHAEKLSVPSFRDLEETLRAAVVRVSPGALRENGEVEVPLHIWRLPSFQAWYRSQCVAGNHLEGARALFTFRVGPGRTHTFLWVLHVNVFVAAEGRNKLNEVVLGRPDTSSVVLWHRGDQQEETEFLLVREFRSPARTSDGMVHELPGGSSSSNKLPEETAVEEVSEETGLTISPSRFAYHGVRQQVGTLSSFSTHLFSVELNSDEMKDVRANLDKVRGVVESSERTFVEVRTIGSLLRKYDTDWSTLGMVLSVLR